MLQVVETEQVQPAPVINDFRELPIYALQESPTNPRRSFDEGKLFELGQSIRSQGVLVPLIVRELDLDRFEVVAGARRFRALDWPRNSARLPRPTIQTNAEYGSRKTCAR